jgi:hypothetical protein
MKLNQPTQLGLSTNPPFQMLFPHQTGGFLKINHHLGYKPKFLPHEISPLNLITGWWF